MSEHVGCSHRSMSIVVTNSNTHLKIVMIEIFVDINKLFKTNQLSLNFGTTHCLEFRTRNFNDNINVCIITIASLTPHTQSFGV